MTGIFEKIKNIVSGPKETEKAGEVISTSHPLKLNGPKYTAYLNRLKKRIKAKRAANKARNIQHQINK